jgi:uncharacterized protein
MKHFILFYEFVDNFLELRPALRAGHLEHATTSAARDELQLAGALVNEPMGVLLFKADTAVTAEAFAAGDPYVTRGMVKSWRVREWTTVVGPDALTKL